MALRHSRSSLIVVFVAAMGWATTLATSGPSQAVDVSAAVEVDSRAEDDAGAQGRPPAGKTAPVGRGRGGVRGDPPPTCGPGAGSCFLQNGSPGCDDVDCCEAVCNLDDFCCIYDWDFLCTQAAWEICDPPTDIGACCDENDDCVGVIPQGDCDGGWYQGLNCEQVVCSDPLLDLCPGEVIEIGSSLTGSTIGANVDLGFPSCGTSIAAPGVWYTVIGNGHSITVTTCNSFTDYDSKINVYCSSCAEPACVGGNDDNCSDFDFRNSTVTFCGEFGAEYYILVQGYEGAVGNFQLDVVDQGSCDDPTPGCTPSSGACCDGLTCTGETEPDQCEWAWYGAQECGTFECPAGACCSYENACTKTTGESDCVGQWYVGEDCATFECPVGEYCEPCYADTDNDWITNVTFNTIDNTTGAEGAPCSYGDYTSITTNVQPGSTYTLTVSFYSGGIRTEHVRAWIDWDRDHEFQDSESYHLGSGVEDTLAMDVTVPTDAEPGCTRMRVRERFATASRFPCEVYTYGEAEDYTLCVEAACPAGEVTYLDPPDNVVDAGVPSDVNGGPLLGIERIRVAGPAGVAASCFTLCENDDGGLGPNSIVDVRGNGDGTYTIELLRPLTPLSVTTLTYSGNNSTGRWTSHPANANADAGAGPIDILSVIDYLNGADEPPHGLYSVDVNRSGVGETSDILAVIDLLNGAGVFSAYLDTTLPVNTDCP